MKCPRCRQELGSSAQYCGRCGCPTSFKAVLDAATSSADHDHASRRELVVIYMLDISMRGGGMVPIADAVVSETLRALREGAERDPRLDVKVAALEFHSYGNWWTNPEGLVHLYDFSYKCSVPGSVGSDPTSALRALNEGLSREGLLKDTGPLPMVLVIIASNGYFSSPNVEEFDEIWAELHQNTWYRHAWRFVFAHHSESDALTKETRGSHSVLDPSEPDGFAPFSAFVRNLERDPWWDLPQRRNRTLATNGHLTLDEAVEVALWRCGEEVLRDPAEMLIIADDLLDRESELTWLFIWSCDEELLSPYARAYAGDGEMEAAVRNALTLLRDRHQVPEGISRSIAEDLALGVLRARMAQGETTNRGDGPRQQPADLHGSCPGQ